jgi:hypothetical protein
MREFLTSGQVGNIELDAQKKIHETIMNRWDGLGFLEGMSNSLKENVALLYENQAKLILNEATDANNSGSFETVVFPIIRRVFSKLLANEIVSVQAMNLPVGKLFFILPVTSEREWEGLGANGELQDGATGSHTGLMGYNRVNRNKQGAIEPRYYLPDEVVNDITGEWTVFKADGTTLGTNYASYEAALSAATGATPPIPATNIRKNGPEVVQYFEKTLYDLFYNDFLFDNSKGKVTIRVGTAKPVVLTPFGWQALTSFQNVPMNADGTIRNIILQVSGFNAFNAGKLTGPDGNEMDTEAFLASLKVVNKSAVDSISGSSAFAAGESIPFRLVTQKYGKGVVEYSNICDPQGNIYLELDFAKPTVNQGQTIDGYIGVNPQAVSAITNADTAFTIAWAQYDSLELETEIGEVSFKLESVVVSVEERKLRATWSPELAQDVSAFHNIDAEAELTAILSEQIGAEIDREILRDLRKAAPWHLRFDYNGWVRRAGFSTNYTQKDWNQMLFTKINQISAQIQKATLRGGANFLVVSTEVSALLNDLEYFHVTDAQAESDVYSAGIERIGTLANRYKVFVDPYSPHWSIIIGHKSANLLDTGYIYAPYIPMQLTPTMYNPNNFAPVKGIMTRYAKKLVNNRYYGHIRVDGITHWDINELR